MTVCVGALCRDGDDPCIVLCCDTRIGVQDFGSSDGGYKFDVIRPGIAAMMAGGFSRAKELVMRYQQFLGDETLTPMNVLDRFRYPPQRQKTLLVDEYFRLRWSVTRQEYLDGILGQLPEGDRARIAADVENISLQASLVIATFVEGEPFLLTVQDNGTVLRDHDFTVIGSGYAIAYPALCQRQCNPEFSLPRALYAVYEAKKLSEVETTVGPNTQIWVMTKNGTRTILQQKMRLLDRMVGRFGPRRMPRGLELPDGLFIEADR